MNKQITVTYPVQNRMVTVPQVLKARTTSQVVHPTQSQLEAPKTPMKILVIAMNPKIILKMKILEMAMNPKMKMKMKIQRILVVVR